MAAFVKYNSFIDELCKGGHNLATAVFKCALTDTPPTAASDTVWNTTVAPAPAAANGYTAGGIWAWYVDFPNKAGYLQRNGVFFNGVGGVPGNPLSGAARTGNSVTWTGSPTLYPGLTMYGFDPVKPNPAMVRIRTVQFLYPAVGSYVAWG